MTSPYPGLDGLEVGSGSLLDNPDNPTLHGHHESTKATLYTINLFNNVMLLEICSNFANFTPGQRFSLANFNLKLTQQSLPLLGFLECNTLLTHAAVPLCFSLMVALLLTTSTFPLAFASHRFTRSSTDAPPVNGHHSILVRNP